MIPLNPISPTSPTPPHPAERVQRVARTLHDAVQAVVSSSRQTEEQSGDSEEPFIDATQLQLPQIYHDILRSHRTVNLYEDPTRQALALSVIPIDELRKRAKSDTSPFSMEDKVMIQLLKWFKTEFFRWTNALRCEPCNSTSFFIWLSNPILR